MATVAPPEFWTWLTRWGWDSIVFPMTDPFGAVTGIVLRGLNTKRYENYVAYPKDLCPPCFGLHIGLPAAYYSKRMILTEGVFDYLAIVPFAKDSLASLTSIPSTLLRRMLARYVTKVVTLADMDKAGRRAAYRLAGVPVPEAYREVKDKLQTRVHAPPYHVVIPAYSEHDPADLLRAGKFEELQRLARL